MLSTAVLARHRALAAARPLTASTSQSRPLWFVLQTIESQPRCGTNRRSFSAHVKQEEPPNKELTPWQKLQKWMQPFVDGTKGLYLENKQAWQVRSRLKASGKDGQQPSAVLTRQEMMVLRQAHRDLIKSLPLLIFFAIPLVGYAAPLIGYQFPKQLLPWQFWRPDQKTQFFQEDALARAKFYPELVDLLLQIDKKDKCLKEMLALHGDRREGLDPAQVTELVPFFDETANGPAALPALQRHHVAVLFRSIAIVPAFSWVIQLTPKSMLERYLQRRIEELRVDDQLLLKEGIDSLSLSELEFACEERGIVDGYGRIEEMRAALKEWLAMYDTDHPDRRQPLPTSLLLHAPALLNPSGTKHTPQ